MSRGFLRGMGRRKGSVESSVPFCVPKRTSPPIHPDPRYTTGGPGTVGGDPPRGEGGTDDQRDVTTGDSKPPRMEQNPCLVQSTTTGTRDGNGDQSHRE